MRFVIVGAGAIGGTMGAHLARAGHEVLFVDSVPEHVAAMTRDGLVIEGRLEVRVRVPAVTPNALAGALAGRAPEAVLLAVKALHTADALEPVVPLLGPASYVVSMQNGLNERVIAARIGAARTIGAFVNFGADYQAPGRVEYSGAGALYLGELDGRITPRLQALGDALRSAFLPNTTLTDNIWGYLWGKLGYASQLFATATVDATMADVLGAPDNVALMANLAAEVVQVAEAEGVRCEGFDGYDPTAMRFATPRDWAGIRRSVAQLVALNRASLKQKSGIWRDLAVRHRRTEVDMQLGPVVEIGRGHGLRLPLNERLIELIHDLEAGRRHMSPRNVDDLRGLNRTAYPAEVPA